MQTPLDDDFNYKLRADLKFYKRISIVLLCLVYLSIIMMVMILDDEYLKLIYKIF